MTEQPEFGKRYTLNPPEALRVLAHERLARAYSDCSRWRIIRRARLKREWRRR
jgi:hypothetical protein